MVPAFADLTNALLLRFASGKLAPIRQGQYSDYLLRIEPYLHRLT